MRFAARLNLLATLAGMVWPAHAALLWTASSVQRARVQGGVVVVVVRPGRGAVDAVVVEEVVAGEGVVGGAAAHSERLPPVAVERRMRIEEGDESECTVRGLGDVGPQLGQAV